MTSVGGGFLLLPVLIPGHIWAARRSAGISRLVWSLLPAASLGMVTWALVYVAVGEAKPAIWLVPTVVLIATLAAAHRVVASPGASPHAT